MMLRQWQFWPSAVNCQLYTIRDNILLSAIMPRKKAYSGKKKKLQLRKKKEEKKNKTKSYEEEPKKKYRNKKKKRSKNNPNQNNLKTVFHQEAKEISDQRKKRALQPYDLEEYPHHYAFDLKDHFRFGLPFRPYWDDNTTKEELNIQESAYFKKYVKNLQESCDREDGEFLNRFE